VLQGSHLSVCGSKDAGRSLLRLVDIDKEVSVSKVNGHSNMGIKTLQKGRVHYGGALFADYL
jgi:hypothetical protein